MKQINGFVTTPRTRAALDNTIKTNLDSYTGGRKRERNRPDKLRQRKGITFLFEN